jgi:hypothetical protein
MMWSHAVSIKKFGYGFYNVFIPIIRTQKTALVPTTNKQWNLARCSQDIRSIDQALMCRSPLTPAGKKPPCVTAALVR